LRYSSFLVKIGALEYVHSGSLGLFDHVPRTRIGSLAGFTRRDP
jgi:hypothetical protein